MHLVGEHGETVDAFDLGALDFGVPIGAFDQTDHDFAVKAFGHFMQAIDHKRCALPVSLHHNTKAVPATQGGFLQDGFDYIQ